MNRRRILSIVLAAAALSALAVGSGAFTTVSADRSVSVAVVEDENAYVGVSVCEKQSQGSSGNEDAANPVRVTVTNRFLADLTVTAIDDDRGTAEPNGQKATIGPGESEKFNAHAEESLTVSVSGDSFAANVTADVEERTCGPASK